MKKVGFRSNKEVYSTLFQPLEFFLWKFPEELWCECSPSPLFYREAGDVKCQVIGFISPAIPVNVSPPSFFSLIPQATLHIWGETYIYV